MHKLARTVSVNSDCVLVYAAAKPDLFVPQSGVECGQVTLTNWPLALVCSAGSSGQTTFENVRSGRHRVRVIADDNEAVIRSRIIIMPDSPGFCSLNAINNGVTTIFDSNGNVTSYRIEFRPIGMDVGFICIINRIEDEVSCAYTYSEMMNPSLSLFLHVATMHYSHCSCSLYLSIGSSCLFVLLVSILVTILIFI